MAAVVALRIVEGGGRGRNRVGSVWLLVLVLLVGCGASKQSSSSSSVMIELPVAVRDRASGVAISSDVVRSLTAGRPLRVVQVVPWNVAGTTWGAQVYVALEGPTLLEGDWPRLVVENPAACETCTPDGPLRFHYAVVYEAATTDAVIVDVDTDAWEVKEVFPVPPSPPPTPPGSAPTPSGEPPPST